MVVKYAMKFAQRCQKDFWRSEKISHPASTLEEHGDARPSERRAVSGRNRKHRLNGRREEYYHICSPDPPPVDEHSPRKGREFEREIHIVSCLVPGSMSYPYGVGEDPSDYLLYNHV